jgi:hypothetical protein
MERSDRELIEQALATNFELRKLYEQHVSFEEKLGRLGRQVYLTPTEQVEEKRLKRMKLFGVEKMLELAMKSHATDEAA